MGRRWNVDPKPTIGVSLYSVFLNNSILNKDPDGDIVVFEGSAEFKRDINEAIKYLATHHQGGLLLKLAKSKDIYVIRQTTALNGFFKPNMSSDGKPLPGGTIEWNPMVGLLQRRKNLVQSPASVLNHEIDHGVRYDENKAAYLQRLRTRDAKYRNKEEKRVITGSEQKTSQGLGETEKGEATRTDHDGIPTIVIDPASGGKMPHPTRTTPPSSIVNTNRN